MKRALIAASFGTSHKDADRTCIRPIEDALRAAHPGCEVRRAITSRRLLRRLRAQGMEVEDPAEAIARLEAEGFDEIALAALQVIPGGEYEKVCEAAGGRPVSEPLLAGDADLGWMAALLGTVAEQDGQPLVVMGHGSDHAGGEIYARLRSRLPENVFLACMEGELRLESILPQLKKLPGRSVTLTPLMLTAGAHAREYLAGDGEDSWKVILESRGFGVRLRMQGLGALPEVQARFALKTANLWQPK